MAARPDVDESPLPAAVTPSPIGSVGEGASLQAAMEGGGHAESDLALRAREERFRLIALATRDALYDWDMTTNQTWRNEAYQLMFSPHEPIVEDNDWWRNHLHPEDRARVLLSINEALEAESEFWTEQYRLRRFNGEYARILDRSYILRDGAGKPFRMVGAMIDITEKKRLEAQVQDGFARLKVAAAELEQQNQRLGAEVEERRLAEANLRALSTPILKLWDRVLALPVIGVISEARAAQMMELLPREVVASRALFAILDLTGVERVDAQTASHLLQIVRTVKLLGSRCVLSGISPRIARAMVMLNVPMGEDGLTTFGTLQDALRYVLGQAGINVQGAL